MTGVKKSSADVPDLEKRFGGIQRLYGEKALATFQRMHVCVIGIGGVGSWATEALARSGIGQLTLIDLDHIAESNINRQLHALDSTLGKAKVQVMAERAEQINPHCQVNMVEDFISLDNLQTMMEENYDYVIDCIDGSRVKAALIAWCKRNKTSIITTGGAGGLTDPTRIQITDLSRTEHDALFSKTRRLLRQEYGFSKNLKRRFDIPCVFSKEQPVFPDEHGGVCPDKPENLDNQTVSGLNCAGGMGSAMTVTASFGLTAVSHVLKKLSS